MHTHTHSPEWIKMNMIRKIVFSFATCRGFLETPGCQITELTNFPIFNGSQCFISFMFNWLLAEAIYVRPSNSNEIHHWLRVKAIDLLEEFWSVLSVKVFQDAISSSSSSKAKEISKSRTNVKTLLRNARRVFAQLNRTKRSTSFSSTRLNDQCRRENSQTLGTTRSLIHIHPLFSIVGFLSIILHLQELYIILSWRMNSRYSICSNE